MKDFLAKSRKALVGGGAAAATALSVNLAPAIADGVFTVAEFWATFTWTVGAFVIGAAAVYRVPNKQD